MSGHHLLVYARRAAGLTQDALAKLAGTSQPTLSAYERGTKSPSLVVAERIVEATGHRFVVLPSVEFVQVPGQYGLHPFWLAKALWRLDPVLAFRTVVLPAPDSDWRTPPRRYRLRKRADRASAYELLLRDGTPSELLDHIDGALLVDVWDDLDLPDPIQRAWQPLIRSALPSRRRPRSRDPAEPTSPGLLGRLRPSQRSQYLSPAQEESDDDYPIGAGDE